MARDSIPDPNVTRFVLSEVLLAPNSRAAHRAENHDPGLEAPMRSPSFTKSFLFALLVLGPATGCEVATGASNAIAELPVWEGTPETTIGTLDGAIVFGTIWTVHRGPEGHLYVVDTPADGIRVFTPEGSEVGRVGRRGDGPGEFQSPSAFGWHGDTLWVWDSALQRMSRFDHAGSFLGSTQAQPFPDPGGGPGFRPGRPLPDGSFLATQSLPAALTATGEISRTPVLRATAEGEILDTLYVRNLRNGTLMMSRGDGRSFSGQPFTDRGFASVQDEEETVVLVDWVVEPEPAISVTRRAFSGDTIYRLLMPYDPVPVTPADVDGAVADLAERLRSGSFANVPEPEARRLAREALFVPEYHRPVVSMRSGAGGEVWLRLRALRSGDESEPPRWVVVGADGRVERLVRGPPGFVPLLMEPQGEVWGVLRDELDVNYLTRLRLEEGRDGPG